MIKTLIELVIGHWEDNVSCVPIELRDQQMEVWRDKSPNEIMEIAEQARAELDRLTRIADLVPGLVEALEKSLGWMRQFNETIDDVPYEVKRHMHEAQQSLAHAREIGGVSDGK